MKNKYLVIPISIILVTCAIGVYFLVNFQKLTIYVVNTTNEELVVGLFLFGDVGDEEVSSGNQMEYLQWSYRPNDTGVHNLEFGPDVKIEEVFVTAKNKTYKQNPVVPGIENPGWNAEANYSFLNVELHDIIVVITPHEINYSENISSDLFFLKFDEEYSNLTIFDITILPMPEIMGSRRLDFN